MCNDCKIRFAGKKKLYWCGSEPELPEDSVLKENITCRKVSYIPYSECLKELNCEYCTITQFHSFPNLVTLELSGKLNIDKQNKLLAEGAKPLDIPSMHNLIHLTVYNIFIVKINDHPKIKMISCSFTSVKEMPNKMPTLKKLNCAHTKMTRLPCIPNIEHLEIHNTKISKIGYYPHLKSLNCNHTLIKELPSIMKQLEALYCTHTKIAKLHHIPKIQHLDISNTLITELPDNMYNLETLYLNNTKVSRLPLPDNFYVERLGILNTHISMLPYYQGCQEIETDNGIFADPQYYGELFDDDEYHPIDTLIKFQRNIKFQINKRIIRRASIVIYRNSGIYNAKAACKYADRVLELLGIRRGS